MANGIIQLTRRGALESLFSVAGLLAVDAPFAAGVCEFATLQSEQDAIEQAPDEAAKRIQYELNAQQSDNKKWRVIALRYNDGENKGMPVLDRDGSPSFKAERIVRETVGTRDTLYIESLEFGVHKATNYSLRAFALKATATVSVADGKLVDKRFYTPLSTISREDREILEKLENLVLQLPNNGAGINLQDYIPRLNATLQKAPGIKLRASSLGHDGLQFVTIPNDGSVPIGYYYISGKESSWEINSTTRTEAEAYVRPDGRISRNRDFSEKSDKAIGVQAVRAVTGNNDPLRNHMATLAKVVLHETAHPEPVVRRGMVSTFLRSHFFGS